MCSLAYKLFIFVLYLQTFSKGDLYETFGRNNKLVWCTVSENEQRKCNSFAKAVERDMNRFKYDYFNLTCYQAFNKLECMTKIDQGKVDMVTLDTGEVFIGGRYHSLVPIAQEVYEGGLRYYSVAVVRKNGLPGVSSLAELRGKKACFAGVETLAGWVLPIYTLMKKGVMPIIDCNNHVKSAINFFGPSCAVNSLLDKNNPIGDNSDKLCSLCIGKVPGGKCTRADPYAGFEGAFKCLMEVGDIAFLKHTTVEEMITRNGNYTKEKKENFQLFCQDGSRRPIEAYRSCNWGSVPSYAIVTSSAKPGELREKYINFLKMAVQLYSLKDPNSFVYNTTNQNEFGRNPNDFGRDPNDFNRNPNDFNRNPNDFNRNPNEYNPYNQDDFNRNQNDFNLNPNDFNRNPNDFNRNPNDFNRNPNDFNRNSNDFNKNQQNFYRNDDFGRSFGQNDSWARGQQGQQNETMVFYEKFSIFDSVPAYGDQHNLLFQDNTKDIIPIPEEKQDFESYLGDAMKYIYGIRDCPVNHMTLCVTSDQELEKCIKMRTALKSQLLKPEMLCYKGHSHINCMQAIQSRQADVTLLDASDIYTAGLNYQLIPFISEIYNLNEPEYYVVAVAKEEDPSTELTYLKGKKTCHTGINLAAGWVYPLAYLISNDWIRSYKCNSIRAAAEYFTKSCVPGAISTEYNTDVPYDNMCDLCHGASFRYCRRDASEDYFGYTGAFRCLVEGGGNVAFVKHTTVSENTGGKRKEWWARDALAFDFELLCPDGTRAEVNEYERCNLGKVKSNAVVTRGGELYNETELNAYINLFIYSQQFYGRKEANEFSFSMFYSQPPNADLIFQDATQQLRIIPPEQRYFSDYLGSDFMRARRIVDCHASATKNVNVLLMTLASIIFAAYF